ncbi:DUF7344 domain-containing protein [Haloprofundus salinisoli]|uniref:DUF7344 domain-containing protein n=1 Tax=Haloprofundus salinisoli TaxID=2876193 RepID=UPI001CCD5E35|nr:hypothetical protein [Haloprofundus salinisoli]
MSDDESGPKGGESNSGGGSQLVRYSQVTGNLDAIFDLLSVARLRYVLYYLYGMESDVTGAEEVVDAVCEYEAAGTERADPPSREQVKIDVHHSKLPRLDAAGVVDYDPRQNEVRFYRSPSLEEWLEHARYMEFS